MICYKDKQLWIENKPVLLLSAEVHYYRLDPRDWQDRLDKLKACGFNTVATYVPWLCHEFEEGKIDLTGESNERLNLKSFIELCEKNDLYIFLRPGPFIMAEMKNDGIPFWVYEKHKEAVPTSFEGKPVPTPTLDYLSPGFLEATKKWFRAVMGLAAKHTLKNGGKLIAIQLDNEIGMLSWVSNSPDLTPLVLSQLVSFIQNQYTKEELETRYPFSIEQSRDCYEKLKAPSGYFEIAFHRDLGRYMRQRFYQYVQILKQYCQDFGVSDVLYFINIHGSSAGRGLTFPVGVSQLIDIYKEKDDILSGSDVYFGDLVMESMQDMYIVNGIVEATNHHGKPLTSLEFNMGDSNYGDNFSGRNKSSANDFKTRLFIALGNKLLNCYLFTGGLNYRFDKKLGDGNDRIATTGETHGFAAPIGPTGILNQNFPRMARVLNQVRQLEEKLATSFIAYDELCYGFVPDDYMTEAVYDKSESMAAMVNNLKRFRNTNSWDASLRSLLLLGIKPRTLDVQNHPIDAQTKTLLISSSDYMKKELQQKLVAFVKEGGNLLLHGRIPKFDDEGNPCLELANFLEVSQFQPMKHKSHYQPEITCCGILKGFYAFNTYDYESFTVQNAEPLFRVYETGEIVGFTKEAGKGSVICISCVNKCKPEHYKELLSYFKFKPSLSHDIQVNGIGVMLLDTVNDKNERFLHLLNLDDVDKDFNVSLNGSRVIPNRSIHLRENDALMLPIDVDLGFCIIKYSTLEILKLEEKAVVFRNTERFSTLCIESALKLTETPHISFTIEKNQYLIQTDNRLLEDEVRIQFQSCFNTYCERAQNAQSDLMKASEGIA